MTIWIKEFSIADANMHEPLAASVWNSRDSSGH